MKKKYLVLLLELLFAGVFVWYFLTHKESFEILKNIKIYQIVLIATLQISALIINAFFLKEIVYVFDIKMKSSDSIFVSLISAVGNFFGPLQGGVGIRAIFLKKKYNLSYKKFLYTFAGNYVIIFWINSLIAAIAILILKSKGKEVDNFITWLFFGMFVALSLIVVLPIPQKYLEEKERKNFLTSIINKFKVVISAWHKISKNYYLLAKLSLLTFLNVSVSVLLAYVEFKSINIEVSFVQMMLYSSISSLSILIALTPGGIGIRESLLVLSKNSLNLTTANILAASLVDRGIYFFVMLGFAILIKIFPKLFRKDITN